MLVTIVIVTRNEEKNIGNCLESIKLQTYPKNLIEIIIVDNNSSDDTKKIARKYTKNVFDRGPERSAQRNFGMLEKSKGKYVMYLDADMILSSTVIERAVKKMEESEVMALYVPEIVLGSSYWSKVRRFERSFYDGTVIDCVRILRKDIFKKVGGFDLTMTGTEDWDLDKKVREAGRVEVLDRYDFAEINRKVEEINFLKKDWVNELVKKTPKVLIYHNELGFDLKKYLQKKSYYGQSFAIYKKKWGKGDSDLKKQFGFWYRYFLVFFTNSNQRNIFKFPSLFLGMYFLRFLVGVTYLFPKGSNEKRT